MENVYRNFVTIELVNKCIRDTICGKAAGPDNLTSKHILHARPYVVMLLCDLYRVMIETGYVPDNFGKELLFPLLRILLKI